MVRSGWLIRGALLTACCWLTTDLPAATPWLAFAPLNKRVEADPKGDYSLTTQNGPWMVVATTFQGKDAQAQAQELVVELRKRYKLVAFTHDRALDFKPETGLGLNRDGTPKQMIAYASWEASKAAQRGQATDVVDQKLLEVAVLVGNYASVDDPEAQETLKKIKYMRPDSLQVDRGKGTDLSFARLRELQKQILPNDDPKKAKGPMGHAFLSINPLLPPGFLASKGVDKLVMDMNRDVTYCLLNCKGKYSVQVATFGGTVVIDQHKIADIESGKKIESRLNDAAEKAHRVTLALREKGYEAYEFHDHACSIVTVGSFDSVGTPRADGKIEINPQIFKIMNVFGGKQVDIPPSERARIHANQGMKPEMVAGIPLDIQPTPIEVPQRSFSADYQSRHY